jgi:hypothetical protein
MRHPLTSILTHTISIRLYSSNHRPSFNNPRHNKKTNIKQSASILSSVLYKIPKAAEFKKKMHDLELDDLLIDQAFPLFVNYIYSNSHLYQSLIQLTAEEG